MATTIIADGIYFLSPEGSCWIAVRYSNGKLVDQTEQANAGSHAAANDDWAGVVPDEADEEVSADVGAVIVADVMGDDVHAEMVVVTKQAEESDSITYLGYKISDGNATENAVDFAEAIEVISEWYEDLDSWADGNGDADRHEAIREAIASVERPEGGGLDALENYAGSICTAIAEKLGGKAFYGHGNYAVSAASQAGINLTVTEITDPI